MSQEQPADRVGRAVDYGRDNPWRVLLYVLTVLLAGFYLAPLETGITTALKTTEAITRTSPFAPPAGGFTLGPLTEAVTRLVQPFMINSTLMAVPATILSATFGSMAAYGMTTLDWRGQVAVVVLFVAGIFIPYQAVLVPLSQFWSIVNVQQYGRFGELLELIVTHTAYGIPITTLLFRSYYQNISTEMIEAARLDGASAFTIYRRIILPLSVPMFAVTLIYQFTQIWNDYLFALILTNETSAKVVTQGLQQLSGGIQTQFNLQMAGAFVAAFPTILVYVAFGDKFAKGVAGEA